MQFHSMHFQNQSFDFNLCDQPGSVTLSHVKSIDRTSLGNDFLPDLFLLRIVLKILERKKSMGRHRKK